MSIDEILFKTEVEQELLKQFKEVSPLAAYNQIPFDFDENGRLINEEIATEATEFGKELLNLRPDLHEHLLLYNISNGSGKSFALSYTLALLLTDSHPTVDHKGLKANYWLITNTHLLKTEYSKFFFQSPGILGKLDEVKTKQGSTILLPGNRKARIRAFWNGDGLLEKIENLENGKTLLCFSFNQGDQIFAGQQPIVVCVDEMGERAKKRNASNTFTEDKFFEIINRVGRWGPYRGKWLFMMCYTLIFEEWLRKLMRSVKKGDFIVPSIHPTKSIAKLVQGKMFNPYLNEETIDIAKKAYQILGREDQIRIRQEGRGDEDPLLVFPPYARPNRFSITESAKIQKRAQIEKGWEYFIGIDPGWSDVCAVNFFLGHPIEGLFLIDEIYAAKQTVEEISLLIKGKEELLKFPINVKIIFDPNYIKRTTQESEGKSNLMRWAKAGVKGIPCPTRGRSYDSLFTLIKKDLLKYSEICSNFEMELETHKKDEWGIPLEKDTNHSIDATRYVVNYYHMHFFNKYHVADNKSPYDELPEWKKDYLIQKEYAIKAINNQNTKTDESVFFDTDFEVQDIGEDYMML